MSDRRHLAIPDYVSRRKSMNVCWGVIENVAFNSLVGLGYIRITSRQRVFYDCELTEAGEAQLAALKEEYGVE